MKAIFSKSGNKKDISGKMDRRGVISSSQSGGVNPSTNLTVSQQQNGRGVSSFIPTSATYHNHANGHHVKPLQTVSMQQQSHHQQQQINLPQHMNGHGGIPAQHHPNPTVANTYYSNIPPGSNYSSQGTLGTRQEHHYTNYSLHNQQNFHHSQPQQQSQQIHQRTLTKTYSSSHNQQSHYGSTTATGHANNNANQSAYYGNGANLVNGGVIMNGGGHHSGERSAIGNHQNPSVVMMNQIQHTYSHQQVHHHQHQSQSQSQTQQQLQRNPHLQQPPHHQYQLPSTNHINHHSSNNNSSSSMENLDATEGLPSTLVESMRTLFDILDDTKQGKIRLSDIETRWESDSSGSNGKNSGAEPLIKMGVLEYLRKVTPGDGLLTFDRFCSGLRLALLTTNSNDSGDGLPLPVGHHKLDNKFNNSHNPPQQYFHEQVKNLTHSVKSIQSGPPPPAPPPAYGTTTNNNTPMMQLQSKSNSAGQLPSATGLPVQSNTMNRMSKIPNLSASRLPMPGGMSSGIPTSPNSRTNGNFSGTNGHPTPTGITNSSKTIPLQNGNNHSNTYGGTTKRISEQGTTVALVHPQPPPNPKPISAGNTHQHNTFSNGNGTLKLPKQISTPGLLNRYASRNSSLDDLKASANAESPLFMGTKDRPPSAPILDNGDGDANHYQRTNNNANNENDFNVPNNKQKLRERAKSQERDRGNNANNNSNTYIMNSTNGNSSSRADEKANFAKSRQRTHSMPQLQLNKLKSKSSAVVNFDDSPMEKLTPSPALDNSNISSNNITTNGTNYSRPSVLKNGSKIATSPGGGGSSIPTTKIAQQISTNSLKHLSRNEKAFNAKNAFLDSTITGNNGTSNEKEANNNEFIPPPPKPPRNAMTGPGPVMISTTLVNGVMHDPPLSGSSFGSGQTQSSSATISLSASSSSGTSSTRPEIRNVLHSWQKSMVDKKPVEATLSIGSITSNNSSITVKDTNANTTNLTVVPPLVNGERVNTSENNSSTNQQNTSSDEVKLRTKSNLRRKETARRHTVQSGIDFSTLKRLKQLEQERDVLQQGLSFLNKANEWYSKQLEIADEKIGLLSKGAPTADFWSESHEERLNLLGCRVSEVNSLLTALMDGSSRLPLHMNLQIPTHLSLRTITRLKDQNRQLTHEVSDYSHRVTQLENEKALLLRQLFHQKKSASDETVYM